MHRLLKNTLAAAAILLLAGHHAPARAGTTLDKVRAAGSLTCGVVSDEDD